MNNNEVSITVYFAKDISNNLKEVYDKINELAYELNLSKEDLNSLFFSSEELINLKKDPNNHFID